jgi:hypothetical protein
MEFKTKTWKFWNNLTALSINKSHDCVDEWERIPKYTYEQENPDEEEKICICTQKHLVKMFFFKNKFNNNLIRIGSRCIKQFLQEEFEIIKSIKEKFLKEKKDLKKLIDNRCDRCLSYCDKECNNCKFINDYAFDKLNKGYIKWLREKEKKEVIISSCILGRQIRLLNLLKINKLEIKALEIKYIDLINNLENNYNF